MEKLKARVDRFIGAFILRLGGTDGLLESILSSKPAQFQSFLLLPKGHVTLRRVRGGFQVCFSDTDSVWFAGCCD